MNFAFRPRYPLVSESLQGLGTLARDTGYAMSNPQNAAQHPGQGANRVNHLNLGSIPGIHRANNFNQRF